MDLKDGIQIRSAANRKEWRAWLSKNHTKEKNVWLILYKKESEVPTVHYEEAVDEALCFGWIDSRPNKRDKQSYYLLFSKRNPKSNWSKANRQRAERLIEEGLMAKAGLDLITSARQKGTWTALTDVQNSVIPDDLQQALNKNKKALSNFDAFPPSSKRIILEWILNAKKPETRQKRITETVTLAAKNIKANHYRQ
jgi:uncharacterized protein YdeI (YjbR/CyaY-like superfamily)